MKNFIISILLIFSLFFNFLNCSRHENGKFEDLSNDVTKDSPVNLNEEEKSKIEKAIENKENEKVDIVLPEESGVTKQEEEEFED